MFGIRERNYRYDEDVHGFLRPSYSEFLNTPTWDHIPELYRNDLRSRAEFDPVYHASLLDRLRCRFPGAENITANFSQSWQDFFVLTMLQGKQQGFYLELGASDAWYCNNTWLLEKTFGWQGISIDKRSDIQSEWQQSRPNSRLIIADCLQHDLSRLLSQNAAPPVIDYLQMDLDQDATWQALTRLPHDQYRFRVITFETDIFTGYELDRDRSREFLQSRGYQLVIDNVAVKNYATETWEPFEDWWVDPDLVDPDMIRQFACVDGRTKLPHEIFVLPE